MVLYGNTWQPTKMDGAVYFNKWFKTDTVNLFLYRKIKADYILENRKTQTGNYFELLGFDSNKKVRYFRQSECDVGERIKNIIAMEYKNGKVYVTIDEWNWDTPEQKIRIEKQKKLPKSTIDR